MKFLISQMPAQVILPSVWTADTLLWLPTNNLSVNIKARACSLFFGKMNHKERLVTLEQTERHGTWNWRKASKNHKIFLSSKKIRNLLLAFKTKKTWQQPTVFQKNFLSISNLSLLVFCFFLLVVDLRGNAHYQCQSINQSIQFWSGFIYHP